MERILNHGLEVAVLGLTLGAVALAFLIERRYGRRKVFTWIFVLLAMLSVGNFFDFGKLRSGHYVHHHEHFHFFLGSKYLPQLRYDTIYEAAILATNENGYLLDKPVRYRDPMTFRFHLSPIPSGRQAEIRSRFTARHWQEFKRDVLASFRQIAFVEDHGNTGSPAWAMAAGLFTRPLAYTNESSYLFANLDMLALLVLFLAVGRAFGVRATAWTMIVGLSVPLVFRYLGGALLRMDWLCALGVSICLFEKRHFRWAGLVLGYAVASKFLAGVMVLPFGIRFVIQTVHKRSIDRDQLRYILYAIGGLGIFVVLSGLFFGDFELWRDYYRRMLVTFHQHYYRNQYSLRDLFLQAVHFPALAWNPFPDVIAAKLGSVHVSDVRAAFVAVQLVVLSALGFVAYRNPARFAFALGPLAVFTVLVTNRYYWQMWLVAAIVLSPTCLKNWRHASFLIAILVWLAAGNALEMTSNAPPHGGYFGSYLLFLMLVWIVAVESISWYRERRAMRAGGGVSAGLR